MTNSLSVDAFMENQARANRRRRWLHPLFGTILRILCKVDVHGLEKIPKDGAVVLMMNHLSILDPAIVTLSIPKRYAIAMAKVETLDQWFTRLALNAWGNFTINRGEVDRKSLSYAITLLKNENMLLIAPEGTRNPETGLQEGKDGVVYLVNKANAVIVPTTIVNATDWKERLTSGKRMRATLTFGEPFRFRLGGQRRVNKDVRVAMMREAMYQLAHNIPDEFADVRGIYSDLSQATTQYIEFLNPKQSQEQSEFVLENA